MPDVTKYIAEFRDWHLFTGKHDGDKILQGRIFGHPHYVDGTKVTFEVKFINDLGEYIVCKTKGCEHGDAYKLLK